MLSAPFNPDMPLPARLKKLFERVDGNTGDDELMQDFVDHGYTPAMHEQFRMLANGNVGPHAVMEDILKIVRNAYAARVQRENVKLDNASLVLETFYAQVVPLHNGHLNGQADSMALEHATAVRLSAAYKGRCDMVIADIDFILTPPAPAKPGPTAKLLQIASHPRFRR